MSSTWSTSNPEDGTAHSSQPAYPAANAPVGTEPRTLGNMGKAINAALILVVGAVATSLMPGEDGRVLLSGVEIAAIVLAALRGVLAFGVRPEFGKFGVYLPLVITALIGAVTQLMAALDSNGFQSYEIATVVSTFLMAMGSTYVTSNSNYSDALRSNYTKAA